MQTLACGVQGIVVTGHCDNLCVAACLQVLCAIVCNDAEQQAWLASVGALPLLDRLCLHTDDIHPDVFGSSSNSSGSSNGERNNSSNKRGSSTSSKRSSTSSSRNNKPSRSSNGSTDIIIQNISKDSSSTRTLVTETSAPNNSTPPVQYGVLQGMSFVKLLPINAFGRFSASAATSQAATPDAKQPSSSGAAVAAVCTTSPTANDSAVAAGDTLAHTLTTWKAAAGQATDPQRSSTIATVPQIGASDVEEEADVASSSAAPGREDMSAAAAAAVTDATSALFMDDTSVAVTDDTSALFTDDTSALCLHRQAARLLSMLCLQPDVAQQVTHRRWRSWLKCTAASDDCRLSSYATVALLHLEACLLQHGPRDDGSSSDLTAILEELWPFGQAVAGGSSMTGWRPAITYPDGIHLLNPAAAHHWTLITRQPASLLDSLTAVASAAAVSAASDLSQSDIDPSELAGGTMGFGSTTPWWSKLIAHNSSAASSSTHVVDTESSTQSHTSGSTAILRNCSSTCGHDSTCTSASSSTDPPAALEPEFDIVFVHGIRGGPFVTWRRGGLFSRGAARRHLSHDDCWPSVWLTADVPNARLLSVEYQVRRRMDDIC